MRERRGGIGGSEKDFEKAEVGENMKGGLVEKGFLASFLGGSDGPGIENVRSLLKNEKEGGGFWKIFGNRMFPFF